jgi:hypothetical protein
MKYLQMVSTIPSGFSNCDANGKSNNMYHQLNIYRSYSVLEKTRIHSWEEEYYFTHIFQIYLPRHLHSIGQDN